MKLIDDYKDSHIHKRIYLEKSDDKEDCLIEHFLEVTEFLSGEDKGRVTEYHRKSRWQKFLAVNGPKEGQHVDSETAEKLGYVQYNKAVSWGKKEKLPKAVWVKL